MFTASIFLSSPKCAHFSGMALGKDMSSETYKLVAKVVFVKNLCDQVMMAVCGGYKAEYSFRN